MSVDVAAACVALEAAGEITSGLSRSLGLERYSTLQVRLAYGYVCMRPAADLVLFVRSLLGAEAD